MAMREFSLAASGVDFSRSCIGCHKPPTSWRRGRPLSRGGTHLGSGQCHDAPASRGRGLPQNAEVHVKTVPELWQEFFADPSQWWDNRSDKDIAAYPDFKHKKTQESLWVNNKLNPSWVEIELATMLPGPVQLNLFSWNKRLAAFTKTGQCEKTLALFNQMQREGINPDKFSFVPVLNACARLQVLEEGRRIHTKTIESGCESDIFVGNSLINMYAKCGSVEDAWRVFSNLPTRDVVSWNAMIQGYVKCGQGQKALDLSGQMQCEGVEPTPVTFVGLVNACASLAALEKGRNIHEQIIQSGCALNVFVGNSLIDMYAKCGSMDEALRLFTAMPVRNVVAWSAMIHGYVKCVQGHKALQLYKQMQCEGVKPNTVTFVGVLNACASVAALEEGRSVHEEIIHEGCGSNMFVGNSLVDMYAKCGSIENAWGVFSSMPVHSIVSWNTMIMGFVKCGLGQKALELSRKMQSDGVEPNHVTFVGLLKACVSIGALEEGRRVHEQVTQGGCGSSDSVVKSLIDMYAKSGNIADAWRFFNEMPRYNRVSLNAMIQGLQGQKALKVSRQMQWKGVEPDSVTFLGLLSAFDGTVALEEGRHVHEQIIQRGFESDVFVGTCLMDMYSKCGSIEDAWSVFKKMPNRNVVAWSTMIQGYVKWGQGQKALSLSRQMQREGVEPDQLTFVGVLNACASVTAVGEGRRVHEQIIQRGWESDVLVGSSLVDMYAKCGSIEDAWRVFNRMPSRNVVAWSAMILGYMKCGQQQKALDLSQQMHCEGVEPDIVTFVGLLNGCGAIAAGGGG